MVVVAAAASVGEVFAGYKFGVPYSPAQLYC